MQQNNIPVDDKLIVGDDFGEENGYSQANLLLKHENPPTAMFALSNLISLGAMRAIAENGFRIPVDISLVSFDDQPYSALLASPMTTVEQEKDEIASMAVKLLLEMITAEDTDKAIKKLMLKPKLIIRQSVKNLIH